VHYVFASEADAEQGGVADENTIIDGAQYFQMSFGMGDPEIIYVRPDGYVGLRPQDLQKRLLLDYLAAIYAVRP
jgi:hypothetical protein